MPLAALCQRCALCCDGTLFTTVPLAADEVAAVRRRGLVVLADDPRPPEALATRPPAPEDPRPATTPSPDTSAIAEPAPSRSAPAAASRLPQPCAALRDRRCAIYDERPHTCRRYRCMLLAALEAGEISLPEALDVVGEARAHLAALAADLPGPDPVLSRARAAARDGNLSQETHVLLARAVTFLDRRFRGHTRR